MKSTVFYLSMVFIGCPFFALTHFSSIISLTQLIYVTNILISVTTIYHNIPRCGIGGTCGSIYFLVGIHWCTYRLSMWDSLSSSRETYSVFSRIVRWIFIRIHKLNCTKERWARARGDLNVLYIFQEVWFVVVSRLYVYIVVFVVVIHLYSNKHLNQKSNLQE